jgi:thiol-disulfide isomerase/thioredoxin
MVLEEPLVRAPQISSGLWINTPDPLDLESMRGSVVLIDFWDYTCINCLRTLPYLRSWNERYIDLDFQIIGVHTPEFDFAHDPIQVKSAVGRLGIRWPVVLDNDQKIWTSFANRAWPGLHLIDAQGYIRYRHTGEGSYAQTEAAIQTLLREIDPDRHLPELLPPLRAEDAPGAVCIPTTPELHVDSVSSSELPSYQTTEFTTPIDRIDGRIYLEGKWRAAGDGITLEGSPGVIRLPYHAASVNAVLSPSADPSLLSQYLDDPLIIEIEQDGRMLPGEHFGEDVLRSQDFAALRLDAPRMYNLVRNQKGQPRELVLKSKQPGFTFYAFSFGTCLDLKPEVVSSSKE